MAQRKSGPERKVVAKKPEKKQTTAPSNNFWQFFALGITVAALSALLVYYRQYGAGLPYTSSYIPPAEDPFALGDAAIFTVVEIPGKGKGAIAARNIKQGEVILREQPLFTVPRNINSSPSAFIARQVESLPLQKKNAFLNLSYVNFPSNLVPAEHPDEVALAIFQTNAVSAGESVGIFPRMARLNHGCSSAFNVVYSWREEGAFLIVHALKGINQGEELLTTYTDPKKPRNERKAYLIQQYGFTCTCKVCSLPEALSKASDERLSKISELYAELKTWGSAKIDGLQALNHIRTIWKIEDEEEYWSERGQLAADAAWIAAAHSDAAATRAWAQKAMEWYSYEIGADAHQVKGLAAIAENPERHQAWGTRVALEVGGPGGKKH